MTSNDPDTQKYLHERCEKYLQQLRSSDPLVKFLLETIGSSTYQSILCEPCVSKDASGSFSPDKGIVVCEDSIRNKKHLQQTLSHELVHVYDYHYRNFDWMNNQQRACSEIRAAALSGECTWLNEFYRGHGFPIKNHFIECVKRRAILSLKQQTSNADEALVESILSTCIKDTSPFLYIPY